MLCNESNLHEENGEFRVEGDPTEGGPHCLRYEAGLDPEEEKKLYPQRSIIPSSLSGIHGHIAPARRQEIHLRERSPERILEMCILLQTVSDG